jgi:hypothetical protein
MNINTRITSLHVNELAQAGYFDLEDSPACVALLPFVRDADVGVEIGVYKGQSSCLFLEHCSFMYFIDPCEKYDENPDRDWIATRDAFLATVTPHGAGRFSFIQKFSSCASDDVPMVDFVFIDGNHSYSFVCQDIALYWPKVKSGGFMCGHDYGPGHDDVIRAVDEFCLETGMEREIHQYCWLIRKP